MSNYYVRIFAFLTTLLGMGATPCVILAASHLPEGIIDLYQPDSTNAVVRESTCKMGGTCVRTVAVDVTFRLRGCSDELGPLDYKIYQDQAGKFILQVAAVGLQSVHSGVSFCDHGPEVRKILEFPDESGELATLQVQFVEKVLPLNENG